MGKRIPSEVKQAVLAKFKCQQTGNCCRADGWVYVTAKEVRELAKAKGVDEHTFVRDYTRTEDGWRVVSSPRFRTSCFLCENNSCTVYQARPKACRTYPDWPEIWQSYKRLKDECELCPALRAAVGQLTDR